MYSRSVALRCVAVGWQMTMLMIQTLFKCRSINWNIVYFAVNPTVTFDICYDITVKGVIFYAVDDLITHK